MGLQGVGLQASGFRLQAKCRLVSRDPAKLKVVVIAALDQTTCSLKPAACSLKPWVS